MMPLINTIQYLLRQTFVNDIDDMKYRSDLTEVLYKILPYFPISNVERVHLADTLFRNSSTLPMNERGGDLQLLRTLLYKETSIIAQPWKRDEYVSKSCLMAPSLPEVILGELAGWKTRQYISGLENAQRNNQIEFRVQFLLQVLSWDKSAGGEYQFPREILEEFWNTALVRSEDSVGMEQQYWGGDGVTESMRVVLFHLIGQVDFRRHSGLVWIPHMKVWVDSLGCRVFQIYY